ncbi:MAG: hypothetical protein U9R79_02705 [Armatimonadota bacterium]|nr:hypothetical protein [Armatimonadota bacterium]
MPRYLVAALDARAAYVARSRSHVARTIVRAWVEREPMPPAEPEGEDCERPLEKVQVCLRLPREHVRALDWHAAAVQEFTRSSVLRIIVRAWADRQPQPAVDPEVADLQIRAYIL